MVKRLISGEFYITNGSASGPMPSLIVDYNSVIMVTKIHSTSYADATSLEIILDGHVRSGWVRNHYIDNWIRMTNTIQNLIPGKLYNIRFATAVANKENRVLPYWYLGEYFEKYKQLELPNNLFYIGDIESFADDDGVKDSYTYQIQHVFINKNGSLIKTQWWSNLVYEQIS